MHCVMCFDCTIEDYIPYHVAITVGQGIQVKAVVGLATELALLRWTSEQPKSSTSKRSKTFVSRRSVKPQSVRCDFAFVCSGRRQVDGRESMMSCILPKLDWEVGSKEGRKDSIENSTIVPFGYAVELRRVGRPHGVFNSMLITVLRPFFGRVLPPIVSSDLLELRGGLSFGIQNIVRKAFESFTLAFQKIYYTFMSELVNKSHHVLRSLPGFDWQLT